MKLVFVWLRVRAKGLLLKVAKKKNITDLTCKGISTSVFQTSLKIEHV